MNSTGKAVIIILCAVVLFTSSMFGTIAFFTSTDKVETTFTIGKVNVKITELECNEDGTVKSTGNRVMHNELKMTPGNTYQTEPAVTVLAGSENAYVRVLVTINNAKWLERKLANEKAYSIFNFTKTIENNQSVNVNEKWICENPDATSNGNDNSVTYVFRYHTTVNGYNDDYQPADAILEPVFYSYTLPGEVDQNGAEGFSIKIVAHAIQADGSSSADNAWTNFEAQINASATN